MKSSEYRVFDSNRVQVRNPDTSADFAIQMQAVMATEVLGRLISSGLVSKAQITDEAYQLHNQFLGSSVFLDMVSPTARSEERDANVRAIGEATAFLTNAVSRREPSLMSKIGARLGGLFR